MFLCSATLALESDNTTPEMTFNPNDSDATLGSSTLLNLGTASPLQVIFTLVSIASSLLGIIFLILIIYGGFVWMMARGNEEEVKKAQKIIERAVIGLVVVLLSVSIAYLFYWLFSGSGVVEQT